MTERPFQRIAIVNRGEPAMRLIRAVRDINAESGAGLETIALYTDPDRRSLFVREADEAVRLGPASFQSPEDGRSLSTYLDYRRLRSALIESRAEAAWVGWGFVAEHAEFADLCKEIGVTFIGPPGPAMRQLGDKIASKRLAELAGVPVAPWSDGPVTTIGEARSWAKRLGYPLLIKATAGGGGRGIRKVRSDDELAESFERSRSEARKAFGDDTVFLESMIEPARHVEVQVIADHHGTVWAVGVRDCSLQRRNQKVIEEAPCPVLEPRLEAEAWAAAVRLSRTAGYRNAGTVELLYRQDQEVFYFMEMNTRLQVEHPVTEVTTGLDLVKLQLHVAAGRRLTGSPPPTVGHAIEVRLNAEDPDNQFAPSPGTLLLFRPPNGPGIRVDSGVAEGDEIPPDFDSMIAKIIAHGRDRREALGRLIRALSEAAVVIQGGTSNKALLLELLGNEDVREGRVDTTWLDGFTTARHGQPHPHAEIALLQAAVEVYTEQHRLERNEFLRTAALRRPTVRDEPGMDIELRTGGQVYICRVSRLNSRDYRVQVDGGTVSLSIFRDGPYERWLTLRNKSYHVFAQRQGTTLLIEVDGASHRIARDDGGLVRAPAPAIVLAVNVKEGDAVERGDPLVLLEAMKMEMSVLAPTAGRIRQVMARPNTQVAPGVPLIAMEPEERGEETVELARLVFPFDSGGEKASGAGRQHSNGYLGALEALHPFLLGYDVNRDEVSSLTSELAALAQADASDSTAPLELEDRILSIFVGVLELYSRRLAPGEDTKLSAEDALFSFIRDLGSEGKGLPSAFLERLEDLLRHHGVDSLARSDRLEEALLRIQRTRTRSDQLVRPIAVILERRLKHMSALRTSVGTGARRLLDRLIEATNEQFLSLNDLARRVHFRLFDQPLIEAAQQRVYEQVDSAMTQLVKEPEGKERSELIDAIAASPQPVVGFLSRWIANRDARLHPLILEIYVHRFYGARTLRNLRVFEVDDATYLSAEVTDKGIETQLIASFTEDGSLAETVKGSLTLTEALRSECEVVWDFYVSSPGKLEDTEALPQQLSRLLMEARLPANLQRACFCFIDADRNAVRESEATPRPRERYFTYTRRDGAIEEVVRYRGMHMMWAERRELWRLSRFHVERLPAPQDVQLYRARAKENPKDERLFAFVDVRDLTPLRNGGRRAKLPHLERMFLEALEAIRAVQYRYPRKQRLHWNRIHLNILPVLTVSVEALAEVMTRLSRSALNVGLEKVVLRARVPMKNGEPPVDRAFHFAFNSDRVGRFHSSTPSREPIRTLSPYQQNVVRLRARGLPYPYEIIRMLTPRHPAKQVVAPPGRFEEYDLDDDGQLVPVKRPHGKNRAGVVVGVIQNFTPQYPVGMTRVIILGDPSREMGALAEPECDRIIKALDVAERLSVPVDWFPVSAGAKISLDSGTENLDWTARVLRRIVEFTQSGGTINVVVSGINVGAQSYWNAEATMLMHTRGILIMTPNASMVLTGKRALDYSGGVSAEDNLGIGGVDQIMGPNGQAQYYAKDLADACTILLRHYQHTYVVPGEGFPRRQPTSDPLHRDITDSPHLSGGEGDFIKIGDVFDANKNPARKKPFDIRSVMWAVADRDHQPLERWTMMRDAELGVVWDAHLGGYPVCLIGVESRPITRFGFVPGDGTDTWNAGTLFPLASKKLARAINSASGNRPVVILANLSGFDGSPESMRRLQLEYGAEIGRAVVNFDGPIVFCVVSRYHGGAYVVFSRTLNPGLEVAALEGSFASVIGGAPAAAVVLTREVNRGVHEDPRVAELREGLTTADESRKPILMAELNELMEKVRGECLGRVAEEFDAIHSVQRAHEVGSIDEIVAPSALRPYLIDAVERGIKRTIARRNGEDESGDHLPPRKGAEAQGRKVGRG